MALFETKVMTTLDPVNDHFVSLSVGNTLVLKACGFIEDYQARILDVTETSLRVRTGQAWFEQPWFGSEKKKRMEIELLINSVDLEAEPDAQRFNRPSNSYCAIDVCIRPASLSWSHEAFREEARRMIWALRSYFMAC